jgi:hypothetical protein
MEPAPRIRISARFRRVKEAASDSVSALRNSLPTAKITANFGLFALLANCGSDSFSNSSKLHINSRRIGTANYFSANSEPASRNTEKQGISNWAVRLGEYGMNEYPVHVPTPSAQSYC